MTKRRQRDVSPEDLKDGFSRIGPGDARHSEYHGTREDGSPRWSCPRYNEHPHEWQGCKECMAGYDAEDGRT